MAMTTEEVPSWAAVSPRAAGGGGLPRIPTAGASAQKQRASQQQR